MPKRKEINYISLPLQCHDLQAEIDLNFQILVLLLSCTFHCWLIICIKSHIIPSTLIPMFSSSHSIPFIKGLVVQTAFPA